MDSVHQVKRPLQHITTAALCFLLAACASPFPTLRNADGVNPDDLERAFVSAWNAPNETAIAEFYAPDAELRDVPSSRLYAGHQQILSRTQKMLSDTNGLFMEVLSIRLEQDLAVLEWQIKGSFGGEEADMLGVDGRPFVLPGISVLHLRDGKVTRSTEIYDLASVAYQLDVRFSFPSTPGHAMASAEAELLYDCTLR